MSYISRLSAEMRADPAGFELKRKEEWLGRQKPEVVYHHETTSRAAQIAWMCFAVIIFPVGLAMIVHRLVGKILFNNASLHHFKRNFEWHFVHSSHPPALAKRINFLVDGQIIDAYICARPENMQNGKWVLLAKGLGDHMECIIDIQDRDKMFQQNYVFFNYPGADEWSSWTTKTQLINSYEAVLSFLEADSGIGAKEIICWGRSIGGAVQSDVFVNHKFHKDIHYTRVRDRSFGAISKVFWYAIFLKWCGWELNGVASAERLEELGIDEVILQTAHYSHRSADDTPTQKKFAGSLKEDLYYNEEDHVTVKDLLHDGLLSPQSTLAYALLTKNKKWRHKKFISTSHEIEHNYLPSLQICQKLKLAF